MVNLATDGDVDFPWYIQPPKYCPHPLAFQRNVFSYNSADKQVCIALLLSLNWKVSLAPGPKPSSPSKSRLCLHVASFKSNGVHKIYKM